MVEMGGVELPTCGLGNQIALLAGCENFGLYYIRQQVPMTTICTVVTRKLTRYEQRTTAKLLHTSYRPLNFGNRRILRLVVRIPVLDSYPDSLILDFSCCARADARNRSAFVDLPPAPT